MKKASVVDSIRISGLPYQVEYKPNLDGNLGRVRCSTCIIEVASDKQLVDMQTSTLLHEVIEALNFHMELKRRHQQISNLEVGLYQVLVDNPEFTKLFLKGKAL